MSGAGSGENLEALAASLARARGEQFFPTLAEHLARVLGACSALICEAAPNQRTRTLGVWRDGAAANYEYDATATPCARVQAGETLHMEVSPGEWPGVPEPYRGYFGMPLTASDGAVLGHLCAYFEQRADFSASQRAICEILANRAAAELRLVHVKRERALLRAQRRQLRAEIAAWYDVDGIAGTSAAHNRVIAEARHAATSNACVLVTGEPGTGKELIARLIHAASPRAAKPFTKVDCAALSIDSVFNALPQVFGVTGGGTVFFREIGALTLEMQMRLIAALHSLQTDANRAVMSDVRILASSNRDLRQALRAGAFREDLFARLNAIAIDIPPLRARVEDIAPLVQFFVHAQSRRLGRRIDGIDPDSLADLARHAWPGNVRELITLVERAMVTQYSPMLKISTDLLARTAPAERAALIAAAAADAGSTTRTTLAGAMDFDDTLNTGLHAVQREHILRVLNATHWVIEGNSGAALKLGLKPATLRHRMKKLGISRAQNPLAS